MRTTLLLLCCAGLLPVGCQSTRKGPKPEPPPEVTITPVRAIIGKVVFVNPALRYVVVDFSFGPSPAAEQRLNVYRNGQKVGEIKISRIARNNNFAADVVVGDAALGDDVRDN